MTRSLPGPQTNGSVDTDALTCPRAARRCKSPVKFNVRPHKMLRFIRDLLTPAPKIKIAHPVLGEIQLEQGAAAQYWLREAYRDGELTLSIDTVGGAPPTESQSDFFLWIMKDVEEIYSSLAPDLAIRHQSMQRGPVQPNWHETFRLVGISIPLDGNRNLAWDITFECLTDRSGDLYTCHFENGVHVHTSVDT